MTPRSEQAPSGKSIAASAKATFDLDLGWKYHELMLEVGCAAGTSIASDIVSDMWFLVNGTIVRPHTIAELAAINSLLDDDLSIKTSGSIGGGDLISYVPIPLSEGWRKDVGRGKQLGWNANGIRSLQLQCQLTAIASPTLRLWIVSREPADPNIGFGPITYWKRDDHPASGTPQSYSDIFDLGGANASFLQSVHIFPSTGTARYVTRAIQYFNEKIYSDREYLMNAAILQARNLNPDQSATPRYDIVLDESDYMDDTLDLSKQASQKLELTWNAAPSGNVRIIQLISGVPSLG